MAAQPGVQPAPLRGSAGFLLIPTLAAGLPRPGFARLLNVTPPRGNRVQVGAVLFRAAIPKAI